jgi:hypothetical protein
MRGRLEKGVCDRRHASECQLCMGIDRAVRQRRVCLTVQARNDSDTTWPNPPVSPLLAGPTCPLTLAPAAVAHLDSQPNSLPRPLAHCRRACVGGFSDGCHRHTVGPRQHPGPEHAPLGARRSLPGHSGGHEAQAARVQLLVHLARSAAGASARSMHGSGYLRRLA